MIPGVALHLETQDASHRGDRTKALLLEPRDAVSIDGGPCGNSLPKICLKNRS